MLEILQAMKEREERGRIDSWRNGVVVDPARTNGRGAAGMDTTQNYVEAVMEWLLQD